MQWDFSPIYTLFFLNLNSKPCGFFNLSDGIARISLLSDTNNYEVDCWLPDVVPGESDIFLRAGRRNERQTQNEGIWITVFSGEAKLHCLPSSLGKNETGTKV